MTITKVIKALYVKLGGSLTDTISGIAGGVPVAEYTVISDCIKALYVLYGGDLSEVYSGISDVAVKDYTSVSKALAALAKVAFKGITPTGKITITENGTDIDIAQYATADVAVPQGVMVDESYDISEGKLNTATVTLEGDVVAHIPDGVVTIGNKAFTDNTVIEKVIMPDSVITIADFNPAQDAYGCFCNCDRLNTIIFSNNLETIGNGAFSSCSSLTTITIPDSVTSIGDSAFSSCSSLTTITIPDSVTSIGNSAFNGCTSLTTITIPDSVTSIGNDAFFRCSSLTTITIPDSVTSIGNNTFYSCTSLTDVYYTGTQAQWEQITIGTGAIPAGATIHYEYTPS